MLCITKFTIEVAALWKQIQITATFSSNKVVAMHDATLAIPSFATAQKTIGTSMGLSWH